MPIVFSPYQIVRLECDNTQLYAEVIQVLETRQMCWVRPIVLVRSAQSRSSGGCEAPHDVLEIDPVTEGPDLLWPLNQFHLALDTDLIPLLAAVQGNKPDKILSAHTTAQLIRQFTDQLWAKQIETRSAANEI